MTVPAATVTIRLGDRTIEQLRALLDGWDADIDVHSRAPTVRELMVYIARRHDVSIEMITGRGKTPLLSDLRAAVAWFAYRVTGRSYSEIGRAMGDRDHSSILYQIGRATSGRLADSDFRSVVDDLLDHFGYEVAA